MSALILISTVSLVFYLAMSLLNWVTALRLENAPLVSQFPKVSLLIPLRNEALRVPSLIESLKKLRYPHLEIILLNDESTDGTWDLLNQFSHSSFKFIQGKPLPSGWVGKSWACFQIAGVATGELFLFCDADVGMSSDSIRKTVAWMESEKAAALTVLPFQKMETVLEKAVIPFVMHLPILGLVPLRWVPRIRNKNLVVANGQWFCIRKEAYEEVDGHEAVKSSLLEDMDLARTLMAKGSAVLPVIGAQDIQVRMYCSGKELKEGFTKNLFHLAGSSMGGGLLVSFFSLALYGIPFLAALMGIEKAGRLLGLLILLRLISKGVFRSSWETLLLHPLGFFCFLGLLFRSTLSHYRKKVVWRGRAIVSA